MCSSLKAIAYSYKEISSLFHVTWEVLQRYTEGFNWHFLYQGIFSWNVYWSIEWNVCSLRLLELTDIQHWQNRNIKPAKSTGHRNNSH